MADLAKKLSAVVLACVLVGWHHHLVNRIAIDMVLFLSTGPRRLVVVRLLTIVSLRD